MDFGALPPEINSARMYSGSGSTPLLLAASAWDELAAELHLASVMYQSVVSGLTSGLWTGPASMSMAAAAAPYVSWLSATATQAEETAAHARAVVGAYEIAFAATVPPAEIAANRSLLAALVATNFFGQNTAAIAAAEAHYAEMWARDAAVMYGYADASTVASTVTPFSVPPQTTDQGGSARQQAAVAKAAESSQEQNSAQLVSSAQQALQKLSSSSSGTSLQESWEKLKQYLQQIQSSLVKSEQVLQRLVSTPSNIGGLAKSLMPTPAANPLAPPAGVPAAPGPAGIGRVSGVAPAAAVGRAGTVGGLSVPPSWVAAAPTTTSPGATPLGASTVSAGPDRPAGLLRGIPMSGAGRRSEGFVTRYGFRNTVIPRSPAAG